MKRKTKIIITFTENNLPKAKVKYATSSQLIDAAMMLNLESRKVYEKKRSVFYKLFRFIKRFVAYLRTRCRKAMPIQPQLPMRIKAVR